MEYVLNARIKSPMIVRMLRYGNLGRCYMLLFVMGAFGCWDTL